MENHQVFVYGELQRKGTLLRVLGREPLSLEAKLQGYERTLDPEIDYYMAVKKEGGSIEGKLLTGITDKELLILDEFEGVSEGLYEKTLVDVDIEGGKTRAYIYVKRL